MVQTATDYLFSLLNMILELLIVSATITGILLFFAAPLYFMIRAGLERAWQVSVSDEARVIPQQRWWFFAWLLRRVLCSPRIQFTLTLTIVALAGALMWAIQFNRSNALDSLETMIFVLSLWVAILMFTLTVAGWLLPRAISRAVRVVAPLFVVIASMAVWGTIAYVITWTLLGSPQTTAHFEVYNGYQLMVGGPLILCALLWRRWIRQGDAWFRIWEE